MKKLLSILAVAATVLLTACDEHQDFPDTAMKVTHILTTDGKVMPYETYEQSGKQAIAVVFNINQREEMEGNGYAVYLWDIVPEAFADSIGVEQDTSCDLTAYDGNANTFALYGTADVKSPLAERVFDIWRYGQSAYIPSVAQMRLLYHAKDIIGLYWEKAAYEEAEHAAKFAELLGEVVTDSTKKNLEMRVEAENGATAGKTDLAKRAKALNLDAIHDTVHEMARDEARHGKAFAGLLKRYFGE